MKKILGLLCLVGGLCVCCSSIAQEKKTLLSVEEYAQAIAEDTTAVLVDVRKPEEFEGGHIAGALLLNVLDTESFKESIWLLDKEKTYYVYCRSGRRSQTAVSKMKEIGLTVYELSGGFQSWTEAGKNVEK